MSLVIVNLNVTRQNESEELLTKMSRSTKTICREEIVLKVILIGAGTCHKQTIGKTPLPAVEMLVLHSSRSDILEQFIEALIQIGVKCFANIQLHLAQYES